MTDYNKILLTGAGGFIGRHILAELQSSGYSIDTLSRRPGGSVVCDLEQTIPALPQHYDAVVHAAGTDDYSRADSLNNQGTQRLLKGLEQYPPQQFTYISSVCVYGDNPGEDVEESCFLRPDNPYSRSKIRAEKAVEQWCAERNVICTILRPAAAAGAGMSGKLARMADAIARGKYMHLRGGKAACSLVMADDVAKAVRLTFGLSGVYNVTDGESHSLIDVADAMAANLSTDKRILTLPAGLVKWTLRLMPFGRLRRWRDAMTNSATFSAKKLHQAADFNPYNTVEVMARRHPDYPYKEK